VGWGGVLYTGGSKKGHFWGYFSGTFGNLASSIRDFCTKNLRLARDVSG